MDKFGKTFWGMVFSPSGVIQQEQLLTSLKVAFQNKEPPRPLPAGAPGWLFWDRDPDGKGWWLEGKVDVELF